MRWQVIDSTLHGFTDYAVGATLTTVFPKLAGIEGTRSATQIRVTGAAHAAYSTLTDYPLGIAKLIPYKVHLALDAVGAIALVATPFVTGQYKRGRSQWVPHVALCAFELTSLALSDPTARGAYHGDVETVREQNALDPHRQIHEGGPAVRTPAAAQGRPG
jgi:hypothetical protein